MTTMMTNSPFGLADMEALLWGPSSPTADAMTSIFFHPDKEEQQEGGGASSVSSSSSPPPFYSPPPSPPAVLLHGDKAGGEELSSPWLDPCGQLRTSQTLTAGEEDALHDLDWMSEKMDLSDLDLDSLIGPCSPAEETPEPPEDFLASLDCLPLPPLPAPICADPSESSESCVDGQEVPSSPLSVPEPQEELEIKSEPMSPSTLDLGSEVDVSESETKPVVSSVLPQVPRIVLSLSPTRIVLVLAPKREVISAAPEVVHCAPPSPLPPRSTRTRPYPEPRASPSSPGSSGLRAKPPLRGGGGGAVKPPRDRKQKKMEQNKTAATRYRQKKRAEQDALLEEHSVLERRNVELVEKVQSMTREIEYLKELMEEVRVARMRKGADP
ncbi:activating transcription factor 4b [Mugil cephalus]|uniref:activating transcription factor 4b n=1 Tax=Mugil cephalus TaxID=48193 RepID=UPI001FB6C261|nr:activating transcription factor 4b [Mugil cephalus]